MKPLDRIAADRWGLVFFFAASLIPFFWHEQQYLRESFLSLSLFLIFVLSWDLFCGPTGETNFGHSLFIGGAAYLSAWLHARQGAGPWTSATLALVAVAFVGVVIGWIAARFRGPAFALLTMGCQLAFFQAVFLFPSVFGGEEGLSGVPALARSSQGRYALVVGAAVGVVLLRAFLQRSRAGALLAAIGEDEELAQSSGIRTRRVKVLVFALSATLGGVGGILYAHTGGQVNAELVGSGLSTHIVLMGLVGGARVGPVVAVVLFFLLRRVMAGTVPMDGVVYAVVLLVAVLLFPSGIVSRVAGEKT